MLGSHEPGREFLIRACGILIHDGAVLAQEARNEKGGLDYALPGGHLEFGETLAACMSREFYEETGLNVEAEKLVYVHENFYTLRGVVTHEIGFYFFADLNSEFPTPDRDGYIPSREAHIRIRLLPLEHIRDISLMPPFLRDLLREGSRAHFAGPTLHFVSKEA